MRQQLQQQESEAGLSRQVQNRQVEPEVENACTGESEEQSQQFASQQAAELNVALTRQVYEQRRRTRRIIAAVLGFTLITSLLATLATHLMGKDAGRAFFLSPLWLMANLLVVFAFCSYLIFTGARPRRKARKAVDALTTVADVKSVGPLADALMLDDIPARRTARKTLIDLLPRMQPEDAALLNAAQRAKLCNVLNIPVESVLYKDVTAVFKPAHNRVVEFRVAVLQAFAQVGDERALPVVARLAEAETKTDGERRVRDAARTCLPLLQERVEQLRAPQTLLRASAAEYANPEILLRPAAQSGETSAEQLLRAATPEP